MSVKTIYLDADAETDVDEFMYLMRFVYQLSDVKGANMLIYELRLGVLFSNTQHLYSYT